MAARKGALAALIMVTLPCGCFVAASQAMAQYVSSEIYEGTLEAGTSNAAMFAPENTHLTGKLLALGPDGALALFSQTRVIRGCRGDEYSNCRTIIVRLPNGQIICYRICES